jgi:prephenate dehydratase
MSRRVAYQGEPGAYSDVAIRQHFGDDITPVPFRTFPAALEALASGDCDLAMIPVENAIAGPVRVALDAMAPYGNTIRQVDEHRLVIVLCVLGVPGAMLATVQRVWSHPVALAQCRIFLARHPWLDVEYHADTAGAAREVGELGDRALAAIASELAAERYGLEVLTRGVQDVPHNWTRFLVMARNGEAETIRGEIPD